MGSPTYRQDTRGTSQQWREKLTHNPRTTQEENLPNPTDNIQGAHSEPHSNNKRPPLERNLAALRGMESSPTMPLDFHNVAVPSPQVAQ
ncbi:hypothetical protein YC2023_043899 [Brassica napus]